MELKLPESLIRAMQKKGVKTDILRDASPYREETYDHSDIEVEDLELLRDMLGKIPAGSAEDTKLTRSLTRKLNALAALDSGKPVKSLELLAEALRHYLSKLPHRWVFVEDAVYGESLAYFVDSVHYHPPERRNEDYYPAYTTVAAVGFERGSHERVNLTFHQDDVSGGTTPHELLVASGWTPEDETLVKDYEETLEAYEAVKGKFGDQYVGIGSAANDSGDSWNKEGRKVEIDREGVAAKLIMDDDEGWEDSTPVVTMDDEFAVKVKSKYRSRNKVKPDEEGEEDEEKRVRLPVHPVVRFFSLRTRSFLKAHINSVQKYTYDRTAFDRVVLPETTKQLVDALVLSKRTGDDIMSGKGKGIIFLSSGPPGTGKTLTAEAYSERAKKPLYTVHCAELGTTAESLEEELGAILNRARKWGCILNLDEADVYIHARGSDMNQNAVVGVFLRLLEYFEGVLFMTTNRDTDVDDAVKSRCIAHIRYTLPTREEAKRIWEIMRTQFDVDVLTDKLLAQLVERYSTRNADSKPGRPIISGRTIKQLSRLFKAMTDAGRPATLETMEWLANFQDL